VENDSSVFRHLRLLSVSERLLVLFFLLTLPLSNPWVRGDGVGYYGYARAILIQHNLDFAPDYQHANTSFRESRLDESGQPRSEYRTATGHLENHFTIGPAILWAPFLFAAHVCVLIARSFGASIAADGFSAPYRIAMAFATSLYGFFALFLAFRLAKKFVAERTALLATLAIWGGSSLAVYMYFNPSWSHAHSAFMVAVFFAYWLHTREGRTYAQWILLGAIAGLMLDVYYANVMLLVLVAVEALFVLRDSVERNRAAQIPSLLVSYALFAVALLAAFLPTLITKRIIYGASTETGYIPISAWHWTSPAFLQVLFSANHGLFSWTPLLLISVVGIFLFSRKAPRVGVPVLASVLAFYYFIASYPDWAGISSFGNRFFVSLTVFFVIGLAMILQFLSDKFSSPRSAIFATVPLLLCFVIWNLGLMFQWGTHLIPARGAVSWSEVAENQFSVVPRRVSGLLEQYLFRRKDMMRNIEREDIEQLKEHPTN